jgi:Zn-dependent protease with chaperone function
LIAATYYDGRSARQHPVTLELQGAQLLVSGASFSRTEHVDHLQIPAALGNTPRLILFADGARCEVADHAAFEIFFRDTAVAPTWVARLEARWSHALIALAITLGVIMASYIWALPWAAKVVANRVPQQTMAFMDEQFLKAFDQQLLHVSKLSEARKQALVSHLHAWHPLPGTQLPARILFRSSPEIGPNAFALPGGTVVILDELINLADNDDEILGVLAHEMGHVNARHVLRQMLQASVVGVAMTWYVGDISHMLAAMPTALLQTHYSRDFERDADAFAMRMMLANGVPPSRLADMLEKLEKTHGADPAHHQGTAMDYLSSHPNTAERMQTLRNATKEPQR